MAKPLNIYAPIDQKVGIRKLVKLGSESWSSTFCDFSRGHAFCQLCLARFLQRDLHMAKKSLIRSKYFPYHVVSRTNNKEWFQLPMPLVYGIFSSWINWAHLLFGALTHHFLLMTNHFHWLVSTPDKDLGFVTNLVLTQVSLEINDLTGKINHVFGSRYKWSIISNQDHYFRNVKYIYRNPPKANLCTSVLDYPYSTLGTLWGNAKNTIWLTPHDFDLPDLQLTEKFIEWLDEPTLQEEAAQTQKAFSRKVFRYSRLTCGRRYEPLALPWQQKVSKK